MSSRQASPDRHYGEFTTDSDICNEEKAFVESTTNTSSTSKVPVSVVSPPSYLSGLMFLLDIVQSTSITHGKRVTMVAAIRVEGLCPFSGGESPLLPRTSAKHVRIAPARGRSWTRISKGATVVLPAWPSFDKMVDSPHQVLTTSLFR